MRSQTHKPSKPAPPRKAVAKRSAPRAPHTPRPRKSYAIAALQASLQVLDAFTQREAWSLSDLTQHVGQAKSRTFRILSTFEETGYLTRDPGAGGFRLGPRAVALGSASVKYEQLRWRALPPLQALADETGETAHVGILFGPEVVTVQLVEGKHDVRMHAAVGKRSPAHSSSLGKVLLAYHPEPEIDAYVRAADLTAMTPKTIVDRERLKRNLVEIRAQGYALDDEERELGLRCIAAPITDQTGRVTASVSISAPSIRLSVEGALAAVPKVKDCARLISRMLGSPMLTDPTAHNPVAP